jgi:LssY C-terminus
MRRLKLLGQRLLVFGLGVATVWLILVLFFDVADRRLPLVLALVATYGVAAYTILPRAIRLGARILNRGRIPSYTLTGDGLPGDPVNVALIGTIGQLRQAFAQAGWKEADPLNVVSSWKMARAFVLNHPYPVAPFSTLYLFDRGQDIGFQRAIDDSPRKRHHVRFWGVPLERAEQTLNTAAFWLEKGRPTDDEGALWVGAATKDTGFSLTRLSFQITHATDPDTDTERDFLMSELLRHGVVMQHRSHRPGERLSIGKVNRYVTDGAVDVAELATDSR